MDFVGNQKDVIEYGKGTLLVEAGPGSGKTTVIVERIKHLIGEGVDPETFLVITFTKKAAENLKNKLRRELSNSVVLKMQISTIHSFCLGYLNKKMGPLNLLDGDTSEKKTLFIKKYREKLGFVDESTVLDYQIPAVLNKFAEYTCFNVDDEKLEKYISQSRPITDDYIDFVDSMDYFSKKLLDDHDAEEDDDAKKHKKSWYNARYLKIIQSYRTYLDLLDEYNYVDYDTLQLKTLNEIKDDPDIPYKTIFVDEFQDTDPLQFRIFQVLRENCDYFTAVGDVDQHIYAFRSSFNDFFDELINREDPSTIALNINFRSTENIVSLTEDFIDSQRKESSEKDMEANNKEYNNPNFLLENKNSDEEADNIFRIIRYMKDNDIIKDYSDVAVLYRKHSDKTISALIDKLYDEGIGYSIRGRSDLAEQSEVKSILSMLWYVIRDTRLGRIPSKDELKEQNLKAFCGEYFKTSLFSLDDSTKEYLSALQNDYYEEVLNKEREVMETEEKYVIQGIKKRRTQDELVEIFKEFRLPLVDTEKITDSKDKEFFEKLENIRNQIFRDKSKDNDFIKILDEIKDETLSHKSKLEGLFEKLESTGEENEAYKSSNKDFFEELDRLKEIIFDESTDKILDNLSLKIDPKRPMTVLDVFYKLIVLSNIYDYEIKYNEIANLAILTQTISNYESFLYGTDFKGAFYFLSNVIRDYSSYQKDAEGVNLMTIHAAKGLEFPVTIISSLEKGKFPMPNKDPNHEKDYIFPNDTFYTPNEFLKYKTILEKDENGNLVEKTISLEDEQKLNDAEEERVLYVAMTRAKDVLILSTVKNVPEQIDDIRDHTIPLSLEDLDDLVIKPKHDGKEKEEKEDPIVLNYSKYTKYVSCPYKFDLNYNLGFRRSGMKAANRGSVFHNIMEDVNLKLIEGQILNNQELFDITYDNYNSMFNIEDIYSVPKENLSNRQLEKLEEFEKFKNNVEKYYIKYSLKRKTLEAEYDFELDRNDYILNGSIDLIYKESDNEIVILDYKYAEFDEDHIDGYIKQSYVYASALREIPEYNDYTIKKAVIHFILGDHQHVVEIDEDKMAEELKHMRDVSFELKEGNFEKKPEKAKTCHSCSYRYFCKPKEFAHELYE